MVYAEGFYSYFFLYYIEKMFLLSTYWWGDNQQAMPYYSRPMTLHHRRDMGAKQIEEKKRGRKVTR